MEKKKVIDAVIKVFMEKINSLNSALEDTRDRARDAPGHNVSHSDTSKFQLSNLALGIEKQIMEYKEIADQLKNLSPRPTIKISVGSLFTLNNIENDKEKIFIMLYQGGGEKIIIDDIEITTLSIAAPIAQACLNKEIGDEVNNTFEVVEIQ
jgi:hypothetical protein